MIIDMPTVSMGSSGSLITADRVAYDNDTSGLAADSVQDAIDEVNDNMFKFYQTTVTPILQGDPVVLTRVGAMCTLSFNDQGRNTYTPADAWKIITNIPYGFKPALNIYYAQNCGTGASMVPAQMQVTKSGTLQILVNAQTNWCITTVTYMTSDDFPSL